MQVINESLDDLKRLETAIETATKSELDYSDKLFLLASAAQSKAIAGLALAIKEGGGQDTFGLTLHAPVHRGQGIEFRAKAAQNCLDELVEIMWYRGSLPEDGKALQIIERYMAAFAASALPPNGS